MQNVLNLQRRGFLTEQQVLQAHRFSLNPRAYTLAPTFYRVLHEIIIKEEPLEALEKRRGWPARSAKAILSLILFSMEEVGGSHEERDESEDDVSLREQIEYLKADNVKDLMPVVKAFGLTVREARLFLILQRAPGMQVGKEALLTRLYADQIDDAPDIKIVEAFVSKIRKKLEGTGWRIETIWGVGYKLIGDPDIVGNPKGPPQVRKANDNKVEKSRRNLYWYKCHVYEGQPMCEIARKYDVAPSTVMRVIHNLMDQYGDEELDRLVQEIPAGYSEDNDRLTA